MASARRQAKKKLKQIYNSLTPEETEKLNKMVNKQLANYNKMSAKEKIDFTKETSFFASKLKIK